MLSPNHTPLHLTLDREETENQNTVLTSCVVNTYHLTKNVCHVSFIRDLC